MARKNRRALEQESPGLDISSLIDVCFLLLIYFMVAATIQATEQDTSMQLPSAASGGDPSEIEPLLIRIDSSGMIYVGTADSREPMDSSKDDRELPLLSQRLEMYKSGADLAGNQPVIQVSIDGESEQQRVLDVLNCLAKYDIKAVTFTDLMD